MPYYRRIAPSRWKGIRQTSDYKRAVDDLVGNGTAVSVVASGHPQAFELFAVSFALVQGLGNVSYVTITESMLARRSLVAAPTPGALQIAAANALHCDISMSRDQARGVVLDILASNRAAPDGYMTVRVRDLRSYAAALVANGLLAKVPNHWLWP